LVAADSVRVFGGRNFSIDTNLIYLPTTYPISIQQKHAAVRDAWLTESFPLERQTLLERLILGVRLGQLALVCITPRE
jgi:hypothetical protein